MARKSLHSEELGETRAEAVFKQLCDIDKHSTQVGDVNYKIPKAAIEACQLTLSCGLSTAGLVLAGLLLGIAIVAASRLATSAAARARAPSSCELEGSAKRNARAVRRQCRSSGSAAA